jgi:Domain of unknown function (DUF4355)
MSDEATEQENQTESNAGTGATTFTQDQVNSFVAEERRKAQSQIDEIKKEAESNKALATQADEKIKTIEKALNSKEHEALRYKVALDAGLPPAVAARLQGDDEEALKKDADTLSELLKKPEADRGRMAGHGEGAAESSGADDMNARIRAAANKA